ncbi:peptidylprolyl isomerase [Ferruginivarius sediminum]|uniref:Peptidyl-prolyl cis-trans isomerase n=1 Tax=Ferruginivarius sediminum TaxID=2661937 RepID=A0A369T9L0_9PROT|nr:peptidylprolyl isomerase [Ferruginivarius sediminum]RDD60857.1 peptidylprolyl isomerase [Ferruginivarius sediminum]
MTVTDPENLLYLDVPAGRISIRLRPDLAPAHVARIKELAREGFYDGTPFHRVIDGFMAQGGDPTGTGTGGSGRKLSAEFTRTPFQRGTCGMARTQDPDSADCQFFICLADADFLTGQYTVWGEVEDGMAAVDALKKAPAGRQSGLVDDPDKLIRAQVAADAGT